jgi:ribose 5-phosphate isomerase A
MKSNSPQDRAKRAAGIQAITTYLRNGMRIGLGSGATSRWFLRILGDRVKGMPVADLNEVGELDLAIDGADEINAIGQMIKGGAANFLWEKTVARASVNERKSRIYRL